MDIFTHPQLNQAEQTLEWSLPSLSELAVFVNRLLRFQYPVPHKEETCRAFLLKQCLSAGISKTTLSEMPCSQVDFYVTRLACQVLKVDPASIYDPENININLTLLSLLGTEFKVSQWVKDDIARLASEPSVGLHSDFYREENPLTEPLKAKATGYTKDQLVPLLTSHHYRSDLLECFATQEEGYLACRILTYPFPWKAFIEALSDELQQYININTLVQIVQYADSLMTEETKPVAFYQQMTMLFKTPFVKMPQTGFSLLRPYKMLILVEGKTEKKVLPILAKLSGLDFERHRIHLMAAGGKNQMVKLYTQLSEISAIPIIILLDQDAAPVAEEIRNRLRPSDQLTLLEDGEFEDLYDDRLILETINQGYSPYPEINQDNLDVLREEGLRINQFKALWKQWDLGSFDKIHFADQVIGTLNETGYIPPRLQGLIKSFKDHYPVLSVTDISAL